MFDLEGAIAHSTKDHEGDATKIENAKKLMDICQKSKIIFIYVGSISS